MTKKDNDGRREQYRPFWEAVCVEFYLRLISKARRLTNGKTHDAEDLAQETVFRVLHYSPNPDKIKNHLNYILRAMRHAWMDKWRHDQAAKTDSFEELEETKRLNHPAVEPDVLRILENKELLKLLKDNHGPLTNREMFLLTKHLEGYDCAEIAAMLGEDERIVRADLNAVRAKVRYRLKGLGE